MLTNGEKEYLKLKIDLYKIPLGILITLFVLNCGAYGHIFSKEEFYEGFNLLPKLLLD
jgi:hypothetical protein